MDCQGVVIGAGDLGLRLAALRVEAGDAVFALRRRQLPMPSGIQAIQGDMFESGDLAKLPSRPDWLVFCATPDSRNEVAYRKLYVQGLSKCLEMLQPQRCLFVSSTAVYAQNAGEWVDEGSIADARTFNGSVLLKAEALCLGKPENRVLRLSGITGPGRHMLVNKALLGEGIGNCWSNRIHIDDAAFALSHLIEHPGTDAVFNVSDDEPCLQLEVANWIRAGQQLPPLPVFNETPSGRRISNRRLRASGWKPLYPSYRESYPHR
jgi:electron-transferring-flavoprotein dehydrogenase